MLGKTKKQYLLPAKAVVLFNTFTLFLFLFGAWNYQVTNYGAVIAVVVSCNAAFYIGYLMSVINRRNLTSNTQLYECNIIDKDQKVIKLLEKWTIIAAIIALPDMLYYSRMWTMSFSEIMGRLVVAFTSSNLNYSLSLGYEDSGSILERIVVLLFVLLYFFKFAVLPLTLFYWNKVKTKQKVLCFYICILDVVKWLLKGMNKGLFDIAIVFAAATFIVLFTKNISNIKQNKKKQKRNKKKIIIIAVILIIVAVMIFISNNRARSGNKDTGSYSYYSTSMNLSADRDNVLLNFIPQELHSAALGLDMYLTNGYQGLSYALRVPFEWCYGIGNNQFLISNFRDIFGIDVTERTYLHRIEQKFPWEEAHNWHSLYTWLANDTSFILLPIVFFIYGVLFAHSWMDSLEKHNPYAIIVFCLFAIRFAYTSANNQITSSSFSFIAWYISLAMWYFSNKRIRFKFFSRR